MTVVVRGPCHAPRCPDGSASPTPATSAAAPSGQHVHIIQRRAPFGMPEARPPLYPKAPPYELTELLKLSERRYPAHALSCVIYAVSVPPGPRPPVRCAAARCVLLCSPG